MERLKCWAEREEINVLWVTPIREIRDLNRETQDTLENRGSFKKEGGCHSPVLFKESEARERNPWIWYCSYHRSLDTFSTLGWRYRSDCQEVTEIVMERNWKRYSVMKMVRKRLRLVLENFLFIEEEKWEAVCTECS